MSKGKGILKVEEEAIVRPTTRMHHKRCIEHIRRKKFPPPYSMYRKQAAVDLKSFTSLQTSANGSVPKQR